MVQLHNMLIQTNQIVNDQTFDFDVCIVGAGAAGIALARELTPSNKLIGVLESGLFTYHRKTQHLYKGNSHGSILGSDPTYLSISRLRFFGGTTNQWKGWCRPLDPIDFEKRDWVPDSGWPISEHDLEPYYRQSAEVIGVKPFDKEKDEGKGWTKEEILLPGDSVRTRRFHVSEPRNFGEAYRDDLVKARNVNLLLGANCVEVMTDAAGGHIRELRMATLTGKTFTARAKLFVLAAGAIENARLLLVSDKVQKKGLGNEHDLVGRYFMDHPHHDYGGHAVITDSKVSLDMYNPSALTQPDRDSVAAFSLSEKLQRARRLLNMSALIQPVDPKTLKAGLRRTGKAIQCMDWMMKGKKVVYNQDARHGKLLVRAEASPNRESRVELIKNKDALGVRLPKLHWKLHKTDSESIHKTLELLALQLGKAASGRIQLRLDETQPWHGAYAANHHLGTTRMSDDPKHGVVDRDGKVYGLDNLYVAGSSVFPTSGMAHPTFTIIALTLRLSDHLRKVLEA